MLATPSWSVSAVSGRIFPSRGVYGLPPGRCTIVHCYRRSWLSPSGGLLFRRIRVTPSCPRGLLLRLHWLLSMHGAMILMLSGGAVMICVAGLVPHIHRTTTFTWISPSSSPIINFHSSANRFRRWLLPSCGHFFFWTHRRHWTTKPARGLAGSLSASGGVGFWALAPFVGWIARFRCGFSPVLHTAVVLHRFSPALVFTHSGLGGWFTPVGVRIWSTLIWSIRPSTSDPGVAAAGVGPARFTPTPRARPVTITVPAHRARSFWRIPPVIAGPCSRSFSIVSPAFTGITIPALHGLGCITPHV